MMAYNYTQFPHLSENARHRIREALLKYCELDTIDHGNAGRRPVGITGQTTKNVFLIL